MTQEEKEQRAREKQEKKRRKANNKGPIIRKVKHPRRPLKYIFSIRRKAKPVATQESYSAPVEETTKVEPPKAVPVKAQPVKNTANKANEFYGQSSVNNSEPKDAQEQCDLAWAYFKGYGVEKSDEQAAYWWSTAAEQGHAIAQYNLGVCYERGEGVEQDYKKAAYWYQKS
ncbi:MAG: sel1 repeat family protein, partial [Clostridia bacterium]|nr:sel1 repeat family protein [Clostridia bacterium]